MKSILPVICVIAALALAGCGGNPDEPPIKVDVDEVPKPSDESGTVEMKERTFRIELSAPSPAWSVKINSIYVVGEMIWVLADLTKADGMAAQVITEISDSVTVEAPEIAPVYYLIGETGGWQPGADNPSIMLIREREQIAAGLQGGYPLWPKE